MNLELAGELADGVLLASYASTEQVAYTVEESEGRGDESKEKL